MIIKNTPLSLKLAPDWQEIEPRADAPQLLFERESQLYLSKSDGKILHAFGAVGNVDCPLAISNDQQWAFRYVCETRPGKPDFSLLRGFNLRTGAQSDLLELGLHQWVCWFLTTPPSAKSESANPPDSLLMGLIASDHTDESGIHIRHRLFAFNPLNPPLRTRPLPRDAFYPLACCHRRKEIIFHGAEGIYRLGFNGERLATLGRESGPLGRGAAFSPLHNAAILGGGGLFRWDFDTNHCVELTPKGHWPSWHADRNEIWYSVACNDLHVMPMNPDQTVQSPQTILTAEAGRMEDVGFGSAPVVHAKGRYLLHRVRRKRLRGTTRGPTKQQKSSERIFANEEVLCILDLEKKVLWQLPGSHEHAVWVG